MDTSGRVNGFISMSSLGTTALCMVGLHFCNKLRITTITTECKTLKVVPLLPSSHTRQTQRCTRFRFHQGTSSHVAGGSKSTKNNTVYSVLRLSCSCCSFNKNITCSQYRCSPPSPVSNIFIGTPNTVTLTFANPGSPNPSRKSAAPLFSCSNSTPRPPLHWALLRGQWEPPQLRLQP